MFYNPSEWSGTGHELFYAATDHVMAVTYTTHGGMFVATKPRVWSQQQVYAQAVLPSFDVGMDTGRMAVMVTAGIGKAQEPGHHVPLVLSFFEELRHYIIGTR